jgi:hypothetical protein
MILEGILLFADLAVVSSSPVPTHYHFDPPAAEPKHHGHWKPQHAPQPQKHHVPRHRNRQQEASNDGWNIIWQQQQQQAMWLGEPLRRRPRRRERKIGFK